MQQWESEYRSFTAMSVSQLKDGEFCIVNFTEENSVGVVPLKWITTDGSSYWPSKPSSSINEQAVMLQKDPMPGWIKRPVRVLKTFDTYEEARMKLPTAEVTSDLSYAKITSKRNPRKPAKYIHAPVEKNRNIATVRSKSIKNPELLLPKAPLLFLGQGAASPTQTVRITDAWNQSKRTSKELDAEMPDLDSQELPQQIYTELQHVRSTNQQFMGLPSQLSNSTTPRGINPVILMLSTLQSDIQQLHFKFDKFLRETNIFTDVDQEDLDVPLRMMTSEEAKLLKQKISESANRRYLVP